jgi:integrase
MRPSEYLALRWLDVDWIEETVKVSRTLENGSSGRFDPANRVGSRRKVKMRGWVANRLRQLYASETSNESAGPDRAQQFFKTILARPINSDSLAHEIKSILGEAGPLTMRLYALRHTAATLALSACVPAKVISEQLGHATTAFILDTYAHVLPHMQSEAAVHVEELLRMRDDRQEFRPGMRQPPQAVRFDTPAQLRLFWECPT